MQGSNILHLLNGELTHFSISALTEAVLMIAEREKMKYSDMMQKCDYIHFEAWILNGEITKQLASIDKQAILQQVLVRDAEIMELQDKLSRRNMQIKGLKKKLEVIKVISFSESPPLEKIYRIVNQL